jgi:hypothetical protein
MPYDPLTDPENVANMDPVSVSSGFYRSQGQSGTPPRQGYFNPWINHVKTYTSVDQWLADTQPRVASGQASPTEVNLYNNVRANPDKFEAQGASVGPKKSWFSKNAWWLLPAGLAGGSAAAAFAGGGGAGAGAAEVTDQAISGFAPETIGTGSLATGATGGAAAGLDTAAEASPWLASPAGEAAGDVTFGSGIPGTTIGEGADAGANVGGRSLLGRVGGFFKPSAGGGGYGPALVSGALQGYLSNKSNKRNAQLEESTLDPYRGVRQQAKTANQLDFMANYDFASKPTTIAGRYGAAAGPAESGFTWNPSPETRGTAAAGLALVRGGQGRNPSVTGIPNTAPVANAPAYTPPWLLARRRQQASANPWLS